MSSVGDSAEELRIWRIVWSWLLTDVWEWGFLSWYLCVFKAYSVCRVSSAVSTHWIWMPCGWGQLLREKRKILSLCHSKPVWLSLLEHKKKRGFVLRTFEVENCQWLLCNNWVSWSQKIDLKCFNVLNWEIVVLYKNISRCYNCTCWQLGLSKNIVFSILIISHSIIKKKKKILKSV